MRRAERHSAADDEFTGHAMTIERTRDMETVNAIMKDPAIWPHIHEDGAQDYMPIDHEAFNWLLVKDGDEVLGVFLVHPRGAACSEMHTCLLPKCWGKRAACAAQLLAHWVFTNTPCQKLITSVPAYNRVALHFALAGGGREEGINRASFLRNGEMIDQIMLGMTKQEFLCQQQQSH